MANTEWAEEQARLLLEPLGDRWLHTQGVAKQAQKIASTLIHEDDRSALIAAAYLHDIGYASELSKSGFHPLDGAVYLRGLGYERLAGLVAYHSGASHEARIRGLSDELSTFHDERSEVSEALTYCDLTTGKDGKPVSAIERLDDVKIRYGPDHPVTQSVMAAESELLAAMEATQARL